MSDYDRYYMERAEDDQRAEEIYEAGWDDGWRGVSPRLDDSDYMRGYKDGANAVWEAWANAVWEAEGSEDAKAY